MQTLKRFRSLFDPALEAFLHTQFQSCRSLISDQDIQDIVGLSGLLLRSGGKRIRPYLAWLMYHGLGGNKKKAILEAVVALEVFHMFCLIQDDIIDRGTSRHGIPTAHLQIAARLKQQKRHGELQHIANGQAMLLGDLLSGWASQCLSSQSRLFAPAARLAFDRFSLMVNEVILGQMLDVDLMTRQRATAQLLDEKMRLKTASYSFVRPLQIGAALAGTNPRIDRFCEAFGLALGLAFQIQDDILDLKADPKLLKKTICSDITDRQHTVLTQYIFDHGTLAQQRELQRYFGKPVSIQTRKKILNLFETSGAFTHAENLAQAYFDQAARSLQTVRLQPMAKQGLAELVSYLRQRQY